MLLRILRRRRSSPSGSPFVVQGLSAFFNSTLQAGTEGFVIETVAGNNAIHHGTPTWDPVNKLWIYNGSTQSSTISVNITPFGNPNGRGTVECVLLINAVQNHTFSRPVATSRFTYIMSNPTTINGNWALNPSGTGTFTTGQVVTDGILIHFTWTNDAANACLYMNGIQTKSQASPLLALATGMFAFGTGVGGSAQFFTGEAGFARIYNDVCLSPAQVLQNYNHAKTLFPSLP